VQVPNATASPARVSLATFVSLLNTITGKNSCFRGDLLIDSLTSTGYPFTNYGSSCPVDVAINSPNVSMIEITFPGDFDGAMSLIPSRSFTMNPVDLPHAPLLAVVGPPSNSPVYDPIILIEGTSTSITFTGRKYYCAQLSWETD
jgi:hypothetical protein